MIQYLNADENDIDEIERLYRKHLDNGTALRPRLERIFRDPDTLAQKAVDSKTGKIAGVVIYTSGISFSCNYPKLVKKVKDYVMGAEVYTGEAIFVENKYRGRSIAQTLEKNMRARLAEISRTRGEEIYVLHEMWVYPNKEVPAYGLVRSIFGICRDYGIIPRFYRDYFKNGSLCPVCGKKCVCSARITLSEIK